MNVRSRYLLLFFSIMVAMMQFLSSCVGHDPSIFIIKNEIKQVAPVADGIIDSQVKSKLNYRLFLSQNADGGFGALSPANARQPDLYSTYYFLNSLADLSCLSMIEDKQNTVDWLNSLIQGKLSSSNINEYPLSDLFYSVLSLNLLNEQNRYKSDIAAYLVKYQDASGAYDDFKGGYINVPEDHVFLSTFQAVSILKVIGEPIDLKAENWLRNEWVNRTSLSITARYQVLSSLRLIGTNPGVSDDDESYAKNVLSSAKSVYEIYSALDLLNNDVIDSQQIYTFLNNLQQKDGGYSFYVGGGVDDPQGTFLALQAYSKLKQIPPNKNKILNLILSNQLEDGGFSTIWHSNSLSITTYYTIAIAKLIGTAVPLDVDDYVKDNVKNENRPNYVYPLLLASEIQGLDVSLNLGCASNVKAIINKQHTKNGEELRDLFFSIYIYKHSGQNMSQEAISSIKQELADLRLFGENGSFDNSQILSVYYAIKICGLLNIELPFQNDFVIFLKQMQNVDGTFRIDGSSDMVINHLMIDMLNDLHMEAQYPQKLIAWIEQCKSEYFGFRMKPGDDVQDDSDPLLSTYAALSILQMLTNK